MGKTASYPPSPFVVEGQFLGFILEDGYKIKFLRLSTPAGEQVIKLSKEARVSIGKVLVPGEWVRIEGYQNNEKKGYSKLKAYQIQPIQAFYGQSVEPTAPKPSPATILVCQKSDCCKRGGRAVTEALQTALEEYGLGDRVVIKGTGCMKRCKAGPNIVMPDKSRHTQVTPRLACELVSRLQTQSEQRVPEPIGQH